MDTIKFEIMKMEEKETPQGFVCTFFLRLHKTGQGSSINEYK